MLRNNTVVIFDGHYIWGQNEEHNFQITLPIDPDEFYEAYIEITDEGTLHAIHLTLDAFNRQNYAVKVAPRRLYG